MGMLLTLTAKLSDTRWSLGQLPINMYIYFFGHLELVFSPLAMSAVAVT